MTTEWEQLLSELSSEIAEEFRTFVGDDEGRKEMLLENYLRKQQAVAVGDPDAWSRTIDEEITKLSL